MRMTTSVLLVAAVTIAKPTASLADDQADARAIIDKAIRSMGGQEKLARYQGQTWKEKATYFGAGAAEQYEATYAAQWPDKLRVDIQQQFTLAMDGDAGWERTGGNVRVLSKAEAEEHREGTYAVWVMSLLPLVGQPFNLTFLGEKSVADRPALAVKARSKGHFDVVLYFDKLTGLLVRIDTRFKEARTGREVDQEMTLSGHKGEEASGIKSPTHASIKRNGKLVVEADLEFKHLQTLHQHLFSKP